MEIGLSSIILLTAIFLLRMKLPVDTSNHFTLDDLPALKKKYSFIYSVGIFLTILVFAIAITLGLIATEHTRFDSTIIYSLMFFSLASFTIVFYKWIEHSKTEQWFSGFIAFLNLSNDYNYFKSLNILTKSMLVLTIVLQCYILLNILHVF